MKTLELNQMEDIEGGAPCWMQKASLLAGALGMGITAVSTGGLAAALLAVPYAAMYYDYLENCHPELMQ